MFRKTFQPGVVVFYEGEIADCAYIIETGSVEVFTVRQGKRVLLATLGVGEIFGEMGVIDDSVRSAIVMAAEPTEVLVIDRDHLRNRIEQGDPVLNLLLKKVISRLRHSQRTLLEEPMTPSTPAPPAPRGIDNAFSDVVQSALDWLKLELDMRRGLAAREFTPYFQPIVRLADHELVGFEALARWIHPERGFVPPLEFIATAERCGVVRDIDMAIMGAGCELLAGARSGGKPVFLSVNLSAFHFIDEIIVERIASILERTGFDPACLKVEITESVLIRDSNRTHEALRRIKAQGVAVALDDFGTGYSSLSYLHSFPIDVLKIDQTFVRELPTNERSREIIDSIARLSRSMSLTTVAEGVETAPIAEQLLNLGCDLGQGYYFSRPVPAAELPRVLAAPKLPLL